MNKIELLTYLTNTAKVYRPDAVASVLRNRHMNQIADSEYPHQNVVDAVLVDFINYIGTRNGIDYALYTKDLSE